MVTWIVLLNFYSIHWDLHLEICLIEVLITGVVGQSVVHRSDLVKLPVMIHAKVHTTVHLLDLSCVYLYLTIRHHIALLVQTAPHVIAILLDTYHHILLL